MLAAIPIVIGVGLYKMCKPKAIGLDSVPTQDLELYKLSDFTYVEPEVEPTYKSLGVFRITYYCAGACCNGHNAGLDCKGNPLVAGTIATNDLPYGTVVYINYGGEWVEYTVRDRMAKKDRKMPAIDIFIDLPHEVVQDMGVDYYEVFIKE